MNEKLTDQDFWSGFWDDSKLAPALKVEPLSIETYYYHKWHLFFIDVLKGRKTAGAKMLELGCGNSAFMGYFATRFGYEVSGIDFSENGCRMIKEILKRDQVKGEVFQGDIFNPPDNLIEQFDMVCAFGVLEHFSDTTQTISAFSRFLKPGGILLISIPNFAGLTGFILKKGNRKLYDHHVILTKKALQNAVPGSVLKLIKCQYYVPFYLALFLDFLNEKKGGLKALKIIFSRGLSLLNKIIWWIEIKTGIQLPDSQLFSAGIFLTAEKPENQKGD